MLSRLIELPTPNEVEFLGALEYDEGKASNSIYKLIDKQKIDYVKMQGLEKLHQKFLSNPISYKYKLLWTEGIITKLSPTYLLKFYTQSINPNQEIINTLISKLEIQKQKKVMVYGAGELFIQLLPYLQEINIEIEKLIDSRAEVKTFMVEGYNVVPLAEAFRNKDEATVIVASGVYAKNIVSLIKKYTKINHKNIQIISC